jgi:hypothetical protein
MKHSAIVKIVKHEHNDGGKKDKNHHNKNSNCVASVETIMKVPQS